MDRVLETGDGTFAVDSLAGPVYSREILALGQGDELAAHSNRSQIIEILVWPWVEMRDQRPELRRYFSLNMRQAVARATEIAVRFQEQQRPAQLLRIRPATDRESDVFFRVMDVLEFTLSAAVGGKPWAENHTDTTERERNG